MLLLELLLLLLLWLRVVCEGIQLPSGRDASNGPDFDTGKSRGVHLVRLIALAIPIYVALLQKAC